ncbi:hypothetical protein EVAR_97677_1 [Eumeta japonica]|uniref:Uncharacterized protein n=1 Tax=Eumeta variegata TaxID=151549 RepID=A0A4C1X0T6_EUMVA|nr:hypothetical protein EVAR_97677_1 [Eumeta japonica]
MDFVTSLRINKRLRFKIATLQDKDQHLKRDWESTSDSNKGWRRETDTGNPIPNCGAGERREPPAGRRRPGVVPRAYIRAAGRARGGGAPPIDHVTRNDRVCVVVTSLPTSQQHTFVRIVDGGVTSGREEAKDRATSTLPLSVQLRRVGIFQRSIGSIRLPPPAPMPAPRPARRAAIPWI